MSLAQELVKEGHKIFRWRSYLPLVLLTLLFPAFRHFTFPCGSHRLNEFWGIFCLCVSLFGLTIRVYTIGHVPRKTSGRNTQKQVAEELNTTGIYSVVRHPLYLGNFWIWIGISLYPRHWWLTLLVAVISLVYHERIILAEEAFLESKFADQFRNWSARTPAFLPNFKNWTPSDLPFCWRTALQREYLGLYAIIVIFTAMEAAGHFMTNGRFFPDKPWLFLFIGATVLFVAVRFLRKCTRFLKVVGR